VIFGCPPPTSTRRSRQVSRGQHDSSASIQASVSSAAVRLRQLTSSQGWKKPGFLKKTSPVSS
jgi:hypothetical protein